MFINRLTRTLLFSGLTTLSALSHCPTKPSDEIFYPSNHASINCDPINPTACGASAHVNVPIKRVVGPGIGGANINGDGSLVNPAGYVSNGVVSAEACIELNISWAAHYGATLTVSVNGTPRTVYIRPALGVDYVATVNVDIGSLNFATRNPGGAPTPGQNEILLSMSPGDPVRNCDDCSAFVGVRSVSFEALAPVLMVHGIRSNAPDFAATGFTAPFSAARMPWFALPFDGNTIQISGNELLTKVVATAKEFGAKHAHLVGHSKGGLWSRFLMSRMTNFGVFSLTTLDTPHLGSVLADEAVHLMNFAFAADYAVHHNFNQFEFRDLTVQSLREYNARADSALPAVTLVDRIRNRVQLRSHAADANINDSLSPNGGGFGLIELSEQTYRGFPADALLYRSLQANHEAVLSPDSQGRMRWTLISTLQPRPLNDFVVTTASSWFRAPFVPHSGTPWKKTHASIIDGQIGAAVKQTLGSGMQISLYQ